MRTASASELFLLWAACAALLVEIAAEHDFSLRLLRHLAASVRHQKYHDTDILTVRVDMTVAA